MLPYIVSRLECPRQAHTNSTYVSGQAGVGAKQGAVLHQDLPTPKFDLKQYKHAQDRLAQEATGCNCMHLARTHIEPA